MYKAVLVAIAAAALVAPAVAEQSEQFEPAAPSQNAQQTVPSPNEQEPHTALPSHVIAPELLTEHQIRDIQEALEARGAPMQVDGQWGPNMDAAVRNFQQNENLITQSGELDPLTLMALGLNPLTFGMSGTDETTGQAPPSAPQEPVPEEDIPALPQDDH